MRIIKTIVAALLLAVAVVPSRAAAADQVSVRAILVIASNAKGAADAKLAPYEAVLQRNVPESSFRFAGEGSVSVSGSGKATISLGQGHRIELIREAGGGIRLKVQWMNGDRLVIGTGIVFEPGVPVILGRRSSGDGDVPIVLLIAK